jgi:CHAT domain-containing protein
VQQIVTADAVFAALRPDEALVAITLADDADYVFVLRDHKISLTVTDNGLSRIATLVRRLRTGVERRSSTLPRFDFAAANELYRVTLGSAEKDLDGVKALVVVPSGPLLSVPFETLLTGPADASDYAGAPWLVKRFTISHTPAITNFVELRKIAGGSRAAHPWFGFGDFQPPTLAQATRSFPDASCAGSAKRFADLPRLEGTRAELDAARAIFGAQRDEELLGPAFTAAAVRALPLKQYRILHFAAHALLPSELNCQNQPAIVTSAPAGAVDISGALLDSSQIANLNLDAEAIILSACNTGGAGNGAAESLSGLARSFFYAGSRSLMVTHWDTDDQTAAKLVAATLRNLREAPHDGIAGALTRAQLDYLADPAIDPFFKHPTFWAPFAVIGEGGGTGQGLRAEAGTGLPGATSPSTR